MVHDYSQSLDIESELERLIERGDTDEPEVAPDPESQTDSQMADADTQQFIYAVEPGKDYSEHIAIIEKLLVVASHYDSKIEDNGYT
eukprot:9158065-Pyramimonas_sp.AAC.1